MSELNVMAFAFFLKYVSVCVATLVAGYLAYHGKEGWDWMIFLRLTTTLAAAANEPVFCWIDTSQHRRYYHAPKG